MVPSFYKTDCESMNFQRVTGEAFCFGSLVDIMYCVSYSTLVAKLEERFKLEYSFYGRIYQ